MISILRVYLDGEEDLESNNIAQFAYYKLYSQYLLNIHFVVLGAFHIK